MPLLKTADTATTFWVVKIPDGAVSPFWSKNVLILQEVVAVKEKKKEPLPVVRSTFAGVR